VRIACVVILVLALTSAQEQKTGPREWLRRVAQTYRDKDIKTALDLLDRDDADAQRRAAREVIATHGIVIGATGSSSSETGMWTIPLLRAAGAVHMEAALALYSRRSRNLATVVTTQIEIAELLLDEVGRLQSQTSDSPQWEWVIGQQALSDGSFSVARSILTRGCDRYPRAVDLLIGCGTVYETFASHGIDSTAAAFAISRRSDTNAMLAGFRSERSNNLKRARAALQEAASLDASAVEAMLRLGKVHLDEGDVADASSILERLTAMKTDRRTAYLSNLFLGRVREREKRFDTAIELFQKAIAITPGQSARLSLANRLHAAGRTAEARDLAEAATADRHVEDPWWAYRLGQYWLVEPMLAALRRLSRASVDNPAKQWD
jgi:predicted Zn-dependent protease